LPALMVGILKEVAVLLFNTRAEILELNRGEKSVTWQIKQHPIELPTKQAPASKMSFSFFQFHEALTSCCRMAPLVSESCDEILVSEESTEYTTEECQDEDDAKPALRLPEALEACTPSCGGVIPLIRAKYNLDLEVDLGDWVNEEAFETRLHIAQLLMRVVPAGKVATPWEDSTSSSASFWDQGNFGPYMQWSQRYFSASGEACVGDSPVIFLSHAWSAPEAWDSLMGQACSYSELKAAALCIVAKDLAAKHLGSASAWEDVTFWVDKCCIPQGHSDILSLHIHLIEEFVQLCDGLVVMFTWTYFTRLWCVYEWACFLVFHDPCDLILSADAVYRASTEQRFLDAVRHFRVDSCQCSNDEDRAILARKIEDYYGDNEHFERFLKFTAIALVARSLVLRGARSQLGLGRWVSLAAECGFHDLTDAIRAADPAAWWTATVVHQVNTTSQDMQVAFQELGEAWFDAEVAPLIIKEKNLATCSSIRRSMTMRKNSICTQKSSKTPSSALISVSRRRSGSSGSPCLSEPS